MVFRYIKQIQIVLFVYSYSHILSYLLYQIIRGKK